MDGLGFQPMSSAKMHWFAVSLWHTPSKHKKSCWWLFLSLSLFSLYMSHQNNSTRVTLNVVSRQLTRFDCQKFAVNLTIQGVSQRLIILFQWSLNFQKLHRYLINDSLDKNFCSEPKCRRPLKLALVCLSRLIMKTKWMDGASKLYGRFCFLNSCFNRGKTIVPRTEKWIKMHGSQIAT